MAAPNTPQPLSAIIARWGRRSRRAGAEQVALAVHIVRWIVLGAIAGVFAGGCSYLFLEGLDRVTTFRLDHTWLVWFLPAAGLCVGLAYHYLGGRASQGNALIIDQIHEPTGWLPRRMAPLVLVGTWVTHLFGGSGGREGTALQMTGSVTDMFSRAVRLAESDRSLMLVAAMAGAFGAVFGVPLAGAVFALEVQSVGRVRYEALVPALTASVVGDLVVRGLGHAHSAYPQLVVSVNAPLLAKLAVAGIAFGLAGAVFVECIHGVRALLTRWLPWPPLRPVLGGIGVVGLAVLFGSDWLGLSLPLISRALAGEHLTFAVFALKILFTAITLGSGFPGGEVTPLFVTGATLGAALASPLHVDVTLLAAVGFVAVFASASNTPLACTIMGVELFGRAALLPFAVGCVIAYVFSSHRGIYVTQRIDAAKGPRRIDGSPTLAAYERARDRKRTA